MLIRKSPFFSTEVNMGFLGKKVLKSISCFFFFRGSFLVGQLRCVIPIDGTARGSVVWSCCFIRL